MADYTVAVTAHGLVPAVLYIGTEGSAGKTILFQFSDDWDGFTKEIIFFDNRGNAIVTPCMDNQEVPVPAELTMYGGPHKYTVRGFTLDNHLYIDDQLQVTGTITTTYTAGHNPRLEGRIIPSTLDLFIAQAEGAMRDYLEAAAASGEFDGSAAGFGDITASATSLPPDREPMVFYTESGPDTAKNMHFSFAIPKGQDGVATNVPDGLTDQNGLVYLTVGSEIKGNGVSIHGKNFTILGHYSSLQDLQAAVPNPEVGDAYGVGSSTPYNVYVFDGATHAWANYGAIGSGAITVDSTIVENSTNPVQSAVIQSYVASQIPASIKNPYALTIFGTSYDGSSAQTITMDNAMSDSSSNAVQNQVIKAYVDGLIGDVDTAIAAINAIIGGDET